MGAEAVKPKRCNPLVAGSIPAGGANNPTGELSTHIGEILSFGFWMEKEGYRPATVRSAVEALKSVTSSYLMQPNVLRGIVIAMVAAVVAFLIIQRRILDHTIGRLRQIIRQRSRRQENSET